jgi:hypothetical protein
VVREVHTLKPPLVVLMFAAVAATGACASRPQPVTLYAGPADRQALLGSWKGSYGIEGRRGGIIEFTLTAAGDQAFGDVLMIAEGARQPYARTSPEGGPATAQAPRTELLNIRFVRARDGQLTGELTPYWDPDRRCQAVATFRGVVDGNRMDGTLLSRCESGSPVYMGRWSTTRVGPAPQR